MTKLRSVSLADVARAAGLSTGGTSYALRGHPTIPEATVERVRHIANDLGYKPDLRISSLMATIRRAAPLKSRETIALVWVNTPRRSDRLPRHLQHFIRIVLKGATQRAEQLGCAIAEFWLDDDTLRPNRLNQILRTRGISGIIFVPAASDRGVTVDLDWRGFACAIVGNTDCSPALNRSAHYHYRSVLLALEHLQAEGCTRPAAILSQNVQDRIHKMQVAAFQMNHPSPRMAANSVRFGHPDQLSKLGGWLRRLRPDSLLLGWQVDQHTVDMLRGFVPSDCRLLTLEWQPHGVLPGIDPGNESIAANAVDMVIAQLHRNEFGLPTRPITQLVTGTWHD